MKQKEVFMKLKNNHLQSRRCADLPLNAFYLNDGKGVTPIVSDKWGITGTIYFKNTSKNIYLK